jgi:hypothetical protein
VKRIREKEQYVKGKGRKRPYKRKMGIKTTKMRVNRVRMTFLDRRGGIC